MPCRHLAAQARDTFCRTCGETLPLPILATVEGWTCDACDSPRRSPADFYCPDCGAEQPRPTRVPRPVEGAPRVYPPSPPRCETKNGRGFVCVLSFDHVNDHVFTD